MRLLLRRSSRLYADFRRRFSSESSHVENIKGNEVSDRLRRFFVDKIRVSGPLTVAEYMKTCIASSAVGYYGAFDREHKVFGSEGDFITAPEMSQMFGELLAAWLYNELHHTGYRGQWQLVECGPGTGQLTWDLLRCLHSFKATNFSVHLVETSEALMEEQARTLCSRPSTSKNPPPEIPLALHSNTSQNGVPIYWYNNIDDIPDGFSIFLANEFLDALPVHQFARAEDGCWREMYVGLNEENRLAFTVSKGENLHTRGLIPESIRSDSSRKFWECSPEALTVVHQIADRITTNGGFGLLVDYGHNGERQSLSVRGYKQHDEVSILSEPGRIDITADVDFAQITEAFEQRCTVYGPIAQNAFLSQLGIEVRLKMLMRKANEKQKQQLQGAYDFIMSEMGDKFKVVSVFPRTLSNILSARRGPLGFANTQVTGLQTHEDKKE